MKVIPASSAWRMTATASSPSTVAPKVLPPSPSAETFKPDWPSRRSSTPIRVAHRGQRRRHDGTRRAAVGDAFRGRLWHTGRLRMPEITPTALAPLQRALGYTFQDIRHLQSALVHTSDVNKRPERGLNSSERL